MVLGLFLLGTLKRKISSNAALFGLLVGFLTVMTVYLPGTLGNPLVAWPWYAPIGTLSTVGTTLALNYLFEKGSG